MSDLEVWNDALSKRLSVVAMANCAIETEISNRYKVSGVAVSEPVCVLGEGVFCVSHV